MKHPERLGKYPITGVLGQGAMGVVYKGYDPVIQRTVAIKTIHKALIGDDAERVNLTTRFRNEAKAVGRLSHPGIVAIYEYGEDDTTAFIAMEYVEGRSLERVLPPRRPLPESEALSIMEQLLDALDCAHRAGVWHRDVKPANLIMTPAGQVKLTDFGIARIENMALTQVASTIGTPGYMAPEQYVGEGITHKVDLFAAGVLLYRMLTGIAPFSGPPEVVMYKILHQDPPAPSVASAGQCAAFFDAIVARALAKQAQARWSGAAEFRAALSGRGLAPTRMTIAMPNNDDATVVVVPPGSGAPSASPAAGMSGGSAGFAPAAGGTGGVTAEAMAEVERALVTVVGPIAKAIVRKAARTCADADSLRIAVAQHITDERERAEFVSGAKPASGHAKTLRMTGGSVISATPPPRVTGTQSDAMLTEAMKEAAVPALTAIVGPIGKVFVRRAAQRATTKGQFIALVADSVDASDRARVVSALQIL
jgi:serine/threonine-protein kinase